MNLTNLMRLRFFIKKYKAKENSAPVYVRITVNGRSADISLKRAIDVRCWNKSKGKAKGNGDEARTFNNYLEQVRTEISNCQTELRILKKDTSAEAIKKHYCGFTPEERTLMSLIEYHNTYLKDTLEWGTMKNYMTTQKYVVLFLKKKLKVSDVPLSQLSYSFLVDFEMFLRQHQPIDHHKPCGHNTVLKHIERLRKMINVAIKNEWLERDPFAKYQARFIKNDREFLTEDELERIELMEFKLMRLQWARDLFVFSCFTGLAYSDVMSLKEQNIGIGIDGGYWIITSRKKTNQPVRVPLLPKALEILEKYKGHPRAISTGTVFPTLSNQKVNAYLKEIADVCGIQKNLTFHLARHTFATTITLTNGVPIETVSKMLGHTSIRTTQIYAKVVEKKVSEDMRELQTKLLHRTQRISGR